MPNQVKTVLYASSSLIEWVATNVVLGSFYIVTWVKSLPFAEILGSLGIAVLIVYNVFRIKLTIEETKIKRLEREKLENETSVGEESQPPKPDEKN